MADHRAGYNDVITIGIQVGGIPPFLPIAIQAGRFVAISTFPFQDLIFRNAIGYVTTPLFPFIAGGVSGVVGQTFTLVYDNANRVQIASQPGLTYVVLLSVVCLTRGGTPYSRIYIAPDPPVV